MIITIIKHGKTEYNNEGKRQGKNTNLSLNEDGKIEVENLKLSLNFSPDYIISSPLNRTIETATILFPNQNIVTNDLLLEYDFGELEGVKFSEPLSNFPNNKVVEYNGIKFLLPNSGDSFENFVAKCQEFITFLKLNCNQYNDIAIVTHSTNLEILRALIEGKDWSFYLGQAKQFHGFITIEL